MVALMKIHLFLFPEEILFKFLQVSWFPSVKENDFYESKKHDYIRDVGMYILSHIGKFSSDHYHTAPESDGERGGKCDLQRSGGKRQQWN
jgi:hypothetical protein